MQFINGAAEFDADLSILLVSEVTMFIFTKVVTVEATFKGEGVRYHKLFPGNHSPGAEFVGLNFEAAVFIVEEMSFLGKDSR